MVYTKQRTEMERKLKRKRERERQRDRERETYRERERQTGGVLTGLLHTHEVGPISELGVCGCVRRGGAWELGWR